MSVDTFTVARVGLSTYRWPLAAPVRGVHEHTGWWVAVEDTDGRIGLGDVACWPGFGAGEAATAAALEAVGQLQGKTIPASLSEQAGAVPQHLSAPEVRHGVALALADLTAQRRGIPLAALLCEALGGAPTDVVPLHRMVSTVAGARSAVEAGMDALKIKVGDDSIEADVARIAAIRAAAPDAALRLDANGAWSPAEAQRALSQIVEAVSGVSWVEQPVAGLGPLIDLARQGPALPIAADECLTGPAELAALLDLPAVAAVVIKPMFLGGPLAALRIARRAAEAGKRVVVTHALESAVGRAGALHVAAAVGEGLDYCGLGPVGQEGPVSLAVGDAPGLELDVSAFTDGHDGEGWRWWGARS